MREKKSGICHVFAAKSQAVKKKWLTEMDLQLQSLRDRKSAPPATLPRGAMMGAASSLGSASPAATPPPKPAATVTPPSKTGYEQWNLNGRDSMNGYWRVG